MAPEDTQVADDEPPADPFAPSGGANHAKQGVPSARLTAVRKTVRLRLETWEVGGIEMAKKLDAGNASADIVKWREDWLAGKDGVQLVHSPTLSLDASTRMTTESITEAIYPTEYAAPQTPPPAVDPNANAKDAWLKWLGSVSGQTCPTAFTTRNMGETLEALAQPVAVESATWDVRLTVEDVHLLEFMGYGGDEQHVKEPIFCSFRTGGLVRLKEGEWRLLSSQSPPVKVNDGLSKNRWVTLVRIDEIKRTP